MILRMWSTDPDGVVIEEDQREFKYRAAATAFLAANLTDTASDEFLYLALAEWFSNGKITMLPEDSKSKSFWNVEFSAD